MLDDVDSVPTDSHARLHDFSRLTGRGRWDTVDLLSLKTKFGLSDLRGKPRPTQRVIFMIKLKAELYSIAAFK
jgi:hypothetical protein